MRRASAPLGPVARGQDPRTAARLRFFPKIFAAVENTTFVDDGELTYSMRIADDLGRGKFGRFRLAMSLEDEFEVEFSNDEIRQFVTLGDIARLLSGRYLSEIENANYCAAA